MSLLTDGEIDKAWEHGPEDIDLRAFPMPWASLIATETRFGRRAIADASQTKALGAVATWLKTRRVLGCSMDYRVTPEQMETLLKGEVPLEGG